MGDSRLLYTELEMKSLLLVFTASLVAADPAADPAFLYTVGTPAVYSYAPVTYVVPATGCRNNLGAVVPCNGAVPFVAPIAAAAAPAAAEEAPAVEAVERKRRDADADADADADPALLYTTSYIHTPVTYSYSAYPYHYYGYPYLLGCKKRDADADADADPLLYYTPYAYAPYAYHAYTPYAYAYAGCRNNQGSLVPCGR